MHGLFYNSELMKTLGFGGKMSLTLTAAQMTTQLTFYVLKERITL